MPYLTENRLSDLIDIPIALPATKLNMGDWLVVASVKVLDGMRLSCSLLNLQVTSATVDVGSIAASNRIYGNLGLAYVVLRKDYVSGSPGASGGLDSVIATGLGLFSRDLTAPVVVTQAGTYSWLVANNMQPSSENAALGAGTAIDLTLNITGTARLELSFT